MSTHSPPAIAVAESGNAKLGQCAATYAAPQSCPTSCPWSIDKQGTHSPCYASQGHAGLTFRRLGRSGVASPEAIARAEARAIDMLPADRPLRVHVTGDCRTRRAASIVGSAASRYLHRGQALAKRYPFPPLDVRPWTYTHSWRTIPRQTWGVSLSVLASCETLLQACDALRRGYAPAVVLPELPADGRAYQDTRLNLTVLPCPYQTRSVTCSDCRLCLDDARLRRNRIVIAFAAHGRDSGPPNPPLLALGVLARANQQEQPSC